MCEASEGGRPQVVARRGRSWEYPISSSFSVRSMKLEVRVSLRFAV